MLEQLEELVKIGITLSLLPLDLLVKRTVATAGLDEDVEGEGPPLERIYSVDFVLLNDQIHRLFIHHLKRVQDVTEERLSLVKKLEDIIEAIHTDQSVVFLCCMWWTEKSTFCNDSKGAFRPDKEMLQVVPSVVLPQRGHVVQYGAIGQHSFQPDGVGM